MARESSREWLASLFPITIAVGTLVTLGMLSLQAWAGDSQQEPQKQIVFLLFSIAVFLAVQLTNYRRLLRFSPVIYLLTLLPVFYTVVGKYTQVPFSREVKGAHAWMQFGPVSVQPSEIAKVALVMFLALLLRHEEQQRNHPVKMLAQVLGVALVLIALLVQQPDMGMTMAVLFPVVAMLIISGIPKRYLAALFLTGAMALPLAWSLGTCDRYGTDCTICSGVPGLRHAPQIVKHYQRVRIYSLFSDDPRVLQEGGYQQERALLALGSGGLTGKGAGNVPVSRHVPEAQNDMILAVVGEQYGLLGVSAVLLSYLLLLGTGFAIAVAHREPAGKLLAFGLVALMAGQTLFNIGVVFRLLPVTGLTLPFVSYGGSSLVANFLILGLLVNIARNQKKVMF